MRKYMWPNSCLPSATALISAAQTGSQGRFNLDTVENHAARKSSYEPKPIPLSNLMFVYLDYPRTLREWGRRLESNLTQDLISKDYPSLKSQSDYEVFKRKWQYLFAYAGAGFAQGYIACHMLSFTREVS